MHAAGSCPFGIAFSSGVDFGDRRDLATVNRHEHVARTHAGAGASAVGSQLARDHIGPDCCHMTPSSTPPATS
jgi:hypothetical protein